MRNKLLSFLRKRKILAIFILLVIAGGVSYAYFSGDSGNTENITVRRGNVTQVVSVTGKTNPIESFDLAFEKSGKVVYVNAKVGDKISSGQTLVQLDNSELSAQLKEAQANVSAQKAKLSQLQKGSRPEEILIAETKLANANSALQDAKTNVIDKIQDAYTKSDDGTRSKIDQFFINPRVNPQVVFSISSAQLEVNLKVGRVTVEQLLVAWRTSLDTLNLSSDLSLSISSAKNNLDFIKTFFDNAALAVNGALPTSVYSQTTIDGWKTDVATARTNLNTAITNLSAAEEKLRTAQSNVLIAQQELSLEKAGSTAEEILAQEAQVAQAEASVQAIVAQQSKNIMRSPISGLVTKQDAKVGEIVSANAVLVSIISENQLEIESNVPEVDIGKISVGNLVSITLDAFSGEQFFGHVAYIDPAETIVDGVVNFKVTVLFDREDPRLKSGLTSNLDITTVSKDNVLTLPQYAIVENDRGTFVQKQEGQLIKEVPVVVGIRGKDGFVEIISGVKEGEQVLNVGVKRDNG